MFENPVGAATAGILSMILEVSATPKAGNVDRDHNFPDMRYEDFLISATSSFPAFIRAARRSDKLGQLILESCKESYRKTGRNIHFGTFILLIPLIYNWEGEARDIATKATREIINTDVTDSLAVLEAFNLLKPRVVSADDLSLENEDTALMLQENNLNLYRWMLKAPEENIIAAELTNGFKTSLQGMELIITQMEKENDINDAIVIAYHTLLAEYIDPLVISKHGRVVAEEVRDRAKLSLSTRNFDELDIEFLNRGINPGTIADLTASSIFLALAEGLL